MRSRVPGQVTGMHAYASMDSEEVRHRCPAEGCGWGLRILFDINVAHHDLPTWVDVIAEKVRGVVNVFLRDTKLARWRTVTFSACRGHRDTDELISFIEVGALLREIYLYAGLASDFVSISIRNVVPASKKRIEVRRSRRGRAIGNATRQKNRTRR